MPVEFNEFLMERCWLLTTVFNGTLFFSGPPSFYHITKEDDASMMLDILTEVHFVFRIIYLHAKCCSRCHQPVSNDKKILLTSITSQTYFLLVSIGLSKSLPVTFVHLTLLDFDGSLGTTVLLRTTSLCPILIISASHSYMAFLLK